MIVKEYLDKLKNIVSKPAFICAVLLIISFYTRIQYGYLMFDSIKGFPKSNDSYWYLENANKLLTNFHINLDLNGILYIGYYGILSMVLLVFKSDIPMILFQLFINAISVILVYKIADIIFNKSTAIIASLFFIFSEHIKRWSVYLLTDSLFISNLLLSVYLILIYKQNPKKKYMVILILSIVYMMFLRPAGSISVAFFMLYFLLEYDYRPLLRLIKRKPIISLITSFTTLSFGIVFFYKALFSSFGQSFYWNMRWLIYKNYSSGMIFDMASKYDHIYNSVRTVDIGNNFVLSFFVNNAYNVMTLYAKRFLMFWGEKWIFEMNITSFEYILNISILGFMLTGMVLIFIKKNIKANLLFAPIISTLIFCMIFFIDSEFRYKAPCIPFNYILAAYGLDASVKYFIKLIMRRGSINIKISKSQDISM